MKKWMIFVLMLMLVVACTKEVPVGQDTTQGVEDEANAQVTIEDTTDETTEDTTEITEETIEDTTAVDDTVEEMTEDAVNTTEEETEVKEINIINLRFLPKDFSINVGDTVRWTNNDRAAHKLKIWFNNVGKLNSPRLEMGGTSWEYTFEEVGEWKVTDAIFLTRSTLKAIIIVKNSTTE